MFYQVVVNYILLYGSETWLITAPMTNNLEVSHIGFTREIEIMHPRRPNKGR